MYKYIALFYALALLASGDIIDKVPDLVSGIIGDDVSAVKESLIDVVKNHVAPLATEIVFGGGNDIFEGASIQMQEPLPAEIAQPGLAVSEGPIANEVMDFAAPAVELTAPLIDLPKGARETVDVPHANIKLPGNSIQNKEVFVHLPRPIVEAPKPIIRSKDVLFRLPQPIFYVSNPIVQHKPMVYRMGHTLRALTPIISTRPYVLQVPQAEISGKSAYQQPIPAHYQR